LINNQAFDRFLKPKYIFWYFWLYAFLTAIFVQFILPTFLPHMFLDGPNGDIGLMNAGDWNLFHTAAIKVFAEMNIYGLDAWQILPSGQGPAGIAALHYWATGIPMPYVLIPMQSFLHGLAAFIFFKITYSIFNSKTAALISAILYLTMPFVLLTYTQISKDVFFNLALLLFLYSLIALIKILFRKELTTKLIIKNNIFKKPLDKFESSFSDFELLYRFLLYVNSDNWINIAKFIFNNHTDYPKIYNILHLNHIFFKDKYFFDLFNTNLPLLDLEGDYINKSQFNFIDHKIEKNELYGTLCIDNKSKNKLLKNIVFKIIRNKNSGTKCETLTSDNLNKIQDSNKHYKDKIHRCIDIAKKLKDANKLLIIPYIKND